ncbi:hypothetical protein RHA1_ro11113 (plasmid) [Rhodococcus jostii RHA1]|uniref:Uncharacterized protein n=1 Tax=Rhodococcus jostii (strain RHA1) TaxID=101510 RepID=Q0RVC6_RHOJR|nr:hypothetical protein RHA1_ro11113 [Rhodococcus jostii RHA1]
MGRRRATVNGRRRNPWWRPGRVPDMALVAKPPSIRHFPPDSVLFMVAVALHHEPLTCGISPDWPIGHPVAIRAEIWPRFLIPYKNSAALRPVEEHRSFLTCWPSVPDRRRSLAAQASAQGSENFLHPHSLALAEKLPGPGVAPGPDTADPISSSAVDWQVRRSDTVNA